MRHLQECLKFLNRPIPNTRWRMRLAILWEVIRQTAHVAFGTIQSKTSGVDVRPEVEEFVVLTKLMCWIDAFGNDERFLLLSLKTLNVSEQTGYVYGISQGAMGVGLASDFVGMFRIARLYHRRAAAVEASIEHRGALSLAYLGLSLHSMSLATWDEAIGHAKRAADIFREIGDLHGWGVVNYMIADANAYRGNFRESLEICADVIQLGKEVDDPQVSCWALTTMGHVKRRLGKLDDAISHLREAQRMAGHTEDYMFYIFSSAELTRCLSRHGQSDLALELLDTTEEFCEAHPNTQMVWHPIMNAATEVYLRAADENRGSGKANCLQKAGAACLQALKQGRAYRGVMPEAMRLKGTYEWLKNNPSSAKRWWKRSVALGKELGQPYDLAMTLLEIGLHLQHGESLDRAESIFVEIGAEWDLARLRFAKTCL